MYTMVADGDQLAVEAERCTSRVFFRHRLLGTDSAS